MKKIAQRKEEEKAKQATMEECFQAIVDVVRENLVATYSKEDGFLGIRLPNGQKFRLFVENWD